MQVCGARAAEENASRKPRLDRIVAMLTKLGQRGDTAPEESTDHVVPSKDTDSDSDTDPEGSMQPANRQPGARQISALARASLQNCLCRMPTVNEIEKLALALPETDRAILASTLLDSLSPILDDEDEGIAEALRRDSELEANPSLGLSLEQLDQRITQL